MKKRNHIFASCPLFLFLALMSSLASCQNQTDSAMNTNTSTINLEEITIADIQKELAVNIHRQHQRLIISDKILIQWLG